MNRKTQLYFGPPLMLLTRSEKNTLEISGRVNRAVERYLEILRYHGFELTEPERECLKSISGIGFMTPEEIRDLPDDVRFCEFVSSGLDKESLADRLEAASFADLVAIVESLGL